VLAQRRFFVDPDRFAAASPELWSIPVCLRAAGEAAASAARCELLSARQQTIELPGCPTAVITNAGGRGYYRTEYAPDLLARIVAAAGELSPAEQIALLQDQWALVRVGRAAVDDFLRLAAALGSSRELEVQRLLVERLQYVERLLDDADRAAYRRWVASVLHPAADELGFAPPASGAAESDDRRALRALLFGALGEAGDAAAVAEARRLTALALAEPGAVDSDLASAAFPVAAANGDGALFDKLLAAME